MSQDKQDQGSSQPRSPESRKDSQSSPSLGKPTAVRGPQAPPGTDRPVSQPSRSQQQDKEDEKDEKRSSKRSQDDQDKQESSPRAAARTQADLPQGFKAESTSGLQKFHGLRRQAVVLLDSIHPEENLVVRSQLSDRTSGQIVATEVAPLSQQEIESQRPNLV